MSLYRDHRRAGKWIYGKTLSQLEPNLTDTINHALPLQVRSQLEYRLSRPVHAQLYLQLCQPFAAYMRDALAVCPPGGTNHEYTSTL